MRAIGGTWTSATPTTSTDIARPEPRDEHEQEDSAGNESSDVGAAHEERRRRSERV